MNNYDVIVIGKGPCGISTAIYLKRYGYNPIIIGKDFGSLEKAHKIENYYGIESISGLKLGEAGVNQAQALGIDVVSDEVLDIEILDSFNVICKSNTYTGKAIMLALGTSRNRLSLANKFEGCGVSYCATCDGFFYRKRKTAIVGSGDYMLHELEVLKRIIPDLTILTNGEDIALDIKDIPVIKEKIVSFNGEEHLESITTTNATYEFSGCFIATGSQGGVSIAKHLGIALDNDSIVVDENMMTNIPGIFAGGDVVNGLRQIIKAASDGAIAATAISKYLKK